MMAGDRIPSKDLQSHVSSRIVEVHASSDRGFPIAVKDLEIEEHCHQRAMKKTVGRGIVSKETKSFIIMMMVGREMIIATWRSVGGPGGRRTRCALRVLYRPVCTTT